MKLLKLLLSIIRPKPVHHHFEPDTDMPKMAQQAKNLEMEVRHLEQLLGIERK